VQEKPPEIVTAKLQNCPAPTAWLGNPPKPGLFVVAVPTPLWVAWFVWEELKLEET